MFGRGDPVRDRLAELLGRHTCMRGGQHFHRAFRAGRGNTLHIALEHRGEGLLSLPFRMLRRERLHPVEEKQPLKIHGLLGPERAVIIKHHDALCRRNKIRRALFCHLSHKIHDAFF